MESNYILGKRFPWNEISNPCIACSREMYKPGFKVEGKVRYHARGKCCSCYRGITYDPLASLFFDEKGKACSRCALYLPFKEFSRNKEMKSGHNSWCMLCTRLITYNLTRVQYMSLLESQGGGCAICEFSPKDTEKSLAVDHDHSCCPGKGSCGKCVRGLLCDLCNRGIGYLKESPKILMTALDYITKERATIGESNK